MGEPIELYSDEETAFLAGEKYLDGLGTVQETSKTHAIVERPVPTITREWQTEIVLQKATGQIVFIPTLTKHTSTIHSSTRAKLVDAHKDESKDNVKVNLTFKDKHSRKHLQLNVPDRVKMYTKGAGNCISRKETVSRWSDKDRQGYDASKKEAGPLWQCTFLMISLLRCLLL